MRLTLSRRRFGALVGASAILAGAARGHDGPHTVRVDIRQFAFDPAQVTIRPGDSVEWVNHDLAPHTATDRNGDWDTGEIGQSATATQRFEKAGSYDYFCAFHPAMAARIIVA